MAENVTTQKLSHWFIQKAKEEGRLLVPSRLMSLLCLSCWRRLAESETPLMNESVEAWERGPVIPSVFHEYKDQGEVLIENPSRRQPPLEPDEDLEGFLNRIWGLYGRYTARQLSRVVTYPGTPWARACDRLDVSSHPVIPEACVREYLLSMGPL